jgi:hypothetical protein
VTSRLGTGKPLTFLQCKIIRLADPLLCCKIPTRLQAVLRGLEESGLCVQHKARPQVWFGSAPWGTLWGSRHSPGGSKISFIIYLPCLCVIVCVCVSQLRNGTLCYSFSFSNQTDSGDETEGLKREG